ncbi:MAG: hypothetical protein NC299_00565 [Lachnospiraceae bacterium]|nr:hypothetical protein [Ruminococcus sp.]MCM1273839.1 hypothetical protein [Lachnospiraceae bacterium]
MLISEYLALRNQISVTTGSPISTGNVTQPALPEENGESFAAALQKKIDEKQGVEFTKHAMQRLSERSIDITAGDTLERLNKGVEIAADKGSSETLVLVDRNAFVVSVKNNKVITTIPQEELMGNIFTNIDSTVII